MDAKKALWKASSVFARDYPRRSSDQHTVQAPRYNRGEFVASLWRASQSGMPGYYSVYSFPRGEPQDGNIPQIDCIFIDLDIACENYDPDEGQTAFQAWRRDMSALLSRARMIADAIIEEEKQDSFRVVLSGHKGLHIYLDFPPIEPENGDFDQFKNGLAEYGETVMEWLDTTAGGVNIDPWVDVDASDLARLARHPNTINHGAEYDDETRWAVPITVEELADLHWDDYLEYTSEPRWPADYGRSPSESASDRLVQYIRNAPSSRRRSVGSSSYDAAEVQRYKEQSNDDIELDDVLFLTSDRPCITAFRNHDEAYDHGKASRVMELNIIGRFIQMGVPIEVMLEFFEPIPGYDEAFTRDLIEDLIGRDYKQFNCENIVGSDGVPGDASQFCLKHDCGIYRRNDELGE